MPKFKEVEIKIENSNIDNEHKSINISEIKNRDGENTENSYEKVEPYIQSAREELLQLHRALWNQKNFMKMKEIVLKEKHERVIFNLKQQLTSKQCLWSSYQNQKRESKTETRTVLYSTKFSYMWENNLKDAKSTRNSSKPETEIATV